MDSEIEYIEANIGNRAHKIIEVEDVAEGIVKYRNGVVTGFFTINYYTYDAPVEIELHCEKGIVKMVGDRASIRFNNNREYIADRDMSEETEVDFGPGIKSYWGTSHIKQIKNYYEALRQGVRPDITGDDAVRTQQMVCAIYESGKTGKRILF